MSSSPTQKNELNPPDPNTVVPAYRRAPPLEGGHLSAFPKLTRVFKEHFEMKVQEGSFFKYLNFRIFRSSLGFSIDQTDHIM